MFATHIEKISHSMLCVTGVYFRNKHSLVNLHLNVGCLSVCCSGLDVLGCDMVHCFGGCGWLWIV